MKNGLEVRCPECGRLFSGEESMLEHLDREHVSDKEHLKELVIEVDAKYLGDLPAYQQPVNGSLGLYGHPQDKVVFKSVTLAFEIPVGKIKRAVAPTQKAREPTEVVIEFEDEAGADETVVFANSGYMADFASELLNLRLRLKGAKEAGGSRAEGGRPKLRCPYCKFTYDEELDKCPHCGAMHP